MNREVKFFVKIHKNKKVLRGGGVQSGVGVGEMG